MRLFKKGVFVLIFSGLLFAQEYNLKKYSMRDGMPSNQVLDLLQSDDGRMWFACPVGVFSYDGTEWYLHSGTGKLPVTEFKKLRKDNMGNVWALPTDLNFPLSYYNGREWIKLPKIITETISNKAVDFDVNVTDTSINIGLINENNQFFTFEKGTWNKVLLHNKENPIHSLRYLEDTLIVASRDGLYRYFNKVCEPWAEINNKFPTTFIDKLDLVETKSGNYLILFGSNWIGKYYKGKFELVSKDIILPRIATPYKTYYGLTGDSQGKIYFCNDLSLFSTDETNNIMTLNYTGVTRFNQLVSSEIDRENNIWISNLREVIKLRRTFFKKFNSDNHLLTDDVSALKVLNDGRIIIGQYGSVTILENNSFRHIRFEDYDDYAISNYRIMEIFEDSRERVWLAVHGYGIGILEENNIRWVIKDKDITFNSFAESSEMGLLVGASKGLYTINENGIVKKHKEIVGFIRKIKKISDETIAICSGNHGLITFKNGTVQNYVSRLQNVNSTYNCLMDPRYGLLVGTRAGLYRVEGDSLMKFDAYGLRIDIPVYLITSNLNNEIWFGTDNGVMLWDGKKLRTYTPSDGLLGTEVNRSAGDIDKNGNFWVGTDLGASQFIGEDDNLQKVPPLIEIIKVETPENEITEFQEELPVLAHDQNNITIHYRGLSFVDESQLHYQVKLNELNGAIIDSFVTKQTHVRFSSLSPGTYQLALEVITADGLRSSRPAKLSFKISNPIYYSIWFLLFVVLLLLAVIYFLISFFSQRTYSEKLKNEVKCRTDELSNKINQLKLTESALRASEEQFKNVFLNSDIGIFQTNVNGNFKLANPAVLKILGYSSINDLFKSNIEKDIYLDTEERKTFVELLRNKKRVMNYQLALRHAGGRTIFVNETARLYVDEYGDEIIEGTIEDITEKKQAEIAIIEAKNKAEKSDKLKSQFLAQMSHEIRTPINSILNFSTLLRDDLKDRISEDLEFGFSIIQNAGRRIMRTIDLLLNMSELQTGTFEMNPRVFNLRREIIDNLFLEFKIVAKEKGIDFKLSDKTKKGGIIFADEYTVGQIFNNLFDNAVKYTQSGGIELKLTEENKDKIVIELIDTGIGISKEFIPDIFTPFTQEDEGYTRKYEGNGLGLALVKQYCDLNKIKISIISKKGEGTTFRLVLNSRND